MTSCLMLDVPLMHTNPNRTPADPAQHPRHRPDQTNIFTPMAPEHEAAEHGDLETLAAIAREDPAQLRNRDAFDRTPLLWVRASEFDRSWAWNQN